MRILFMYTGTYVNKVHAVVLVVLGKFFGRGGENVR